VEKSIEGRVDLLGDHGATDRYEPGEDAKKGERKCSKEVDLLRTTVHAVITSLVLYTGVVVHLKLKCQQMLCLCNERSRPVLCHVGCQTEKNAC
jgi:hypothetical protein